MDKAIVRKSTKATVFVFVVFFSLLLQTRLLHKLLRRGDVAETPFRLWPPGNDTEATTLGDASGSSCFPHRREGHIRNGTIIYLETAYVNLHYETFYSFIHELCRCEVAKDRVWTLPTNTVPSFFVGPRHYLTLGFEKILAKFNETSCGPIFLGTPESRPDLTVVTTTYPSNFEEGSMYWKLRNDPRYIFICHEDGGERLEANASSVYFLTPKHTNYVVPSYFPPSFVLSSIERKRSETALHPPIFLVMGGFSQKKKRNVVSLVNAMRENSAKDFVVRFMGGTSSGASNESMANLLRETFADDYRKIQLIPRVEADEFMEQVGRVDAILPLVDEGIFHWNQGYQNGSKLTSSVMWGLGFRKKMVLYKPLAELFGVVEDNSTYFLHGQSTRWLVAFTEAFGRCLDFMLQHPGA
mmetsp:Transcript_29270/g.66106  ORF Transcript_29270/g.66106 Transcript_29270/m.66106 type:complete len:412 (-) Transcript_29270:235-1470(-)